MQCHPQKILPFDINKKPFNTMIVHKKEALMPQWKEAKSPVSIDLHVKDFTHGRTAKNMALEILLKKQHNKRKVNYRTL